VHLIHGVQVRRVSVFVGIGVVGGLVVGFAIHSLLMALGGPGVSQDPAAIVSPSQAASEAPPATEAPQVTDAPAPTSASTVPGIVRSALSQAATVDDRLAASAQDLKAALAAPTFDTIVASGILRSMSADAVSGLQLAPYIGGWSGGTAASEAMTTFYTLVQQTAAEGLSASIRNTAAYQGAATAMIDVLSGLQAVDDEVRAAAIDAGVDLPAPGSATP
jgi:hypothetical protein